MSLLPIYPKFTQFLKYSYFVPLVRRALQGVYVRENTKCRQPCGKDIRSTGFENIENVD